MACLKRSFNELKSCFVNPALNKKLMWSAITAAIFIGVSLPQTYSVTSQYRQSLTKDGCPTGEGIFVHAAVFFVLTFLVMKAASHYKWNGMNEHSDKVLAKYAAYGALLFLVVSSSNMYNLTSSVMPSLVLSPGCPSQTGVVVHGVVYMVALVLLMYLPRGQ